MQRKLLLTSARRPVAWLLDGAGLPLKDARSTDVEHVYYGCGSRGPSISWRFPLNRSPAGSLTGDLFAVGRGPVLQRVLERAGPLLGLA